MSTPTSSDLELRASRIADPGIDLQTKHTVACELRDMIDGVKDADTPKAVHTVINVVVDRLKNTEPSNQKDSTEYAFRRVLVEILHRIPLPETVRPQAPHLCAGLLHVIATDYEDNAITACKALVDVVRNYRPLTDELTAQFFTILHTVFRNVPALVQETLSEESPAYDDTLPLYPSTRSFKVFAELATAVVILTQAHRNVVVPIIQQNLSLHLEAIMVQSPAQRKAREDYEAMGSYWSGVAPTVKNLTAYTDLIVAQVKMVSFLMYFLRSAATPEQPADNELEQIILATLRLLQDCPTTAIAPRKDLMIVFRYLVSTQQRRVLLPQIDKLLEEQVLMGTSLASQELVRANALGCIADLLHHLRAELTPSQLTRACTSFLRHLHNPYLSNSIHMVSARMIFNMIDVVVQKDSPQGATKLLSLLLEGCVNKLDSMSQVIREVLPKLERARRPENKEKGPENKDAKDGKETKVDGSGDEKTDEKAEEKPDEKSEDKAEDKAEEKEESKVVGKSEEKSQADKEVDITSIEKIRPIASATYAVEKPEELVIEYKSLCRHMQAATRALLGGLKKCDAPVPDGVLISRLFEASINCMPLYDNDQRDAVDAMEQLGHTFFEVDLHVFQEVWTSKIEFINAAVERRPYLMQIANLYFQRESHSPTLVAIILRFCMSRLEMLGEMKDQQAAIAIKWFKTVFIAVTMHPKLNEPILAAHVGDLIMDCFPLAAKTSKPTHYFHLLRALFRAIGGGGGRFELLYDQVLPLLPEMLECLQHQLQNSDGFTRDMIVELCLTVPLRLTHLLPHLQYLMQPLALALRGNPELASQGLRTLELCIDNLTPEFLDPTLNLVLRDLMEALHSHLRPLPANHHHAHTTIRLLGKLGGRNRRLLEKDPVIRYNTQPETAVVRFSLTGMPGTVEIMPTLQLAYWTLRGGKTTLYYRSHAYTYIDAVVKLLLNEGVKGREREEAFVKCLEALFEALHLTETSDAAESLIREIAKYIFSIEVRRTIPRDIATRRLAGPLYTCLLDAIAYGLVREEPEQSKKAQAFVESLMKDLMSLAETQETALRPAVNHFAGRFTALGLEETWHAKSAGIRGIKFMAQLPGLGVRWATERIIEIVRTLLHVLKDMPYELPEPVKETNEILELVVRVCYNETLNVPEPSPTSANVVKALTGIFFAEVSGQNAVVRNTAHHCIDLLSELTGVPVPDLLMEHRDRMLSAIYTKPLRALPFPAQVGMVEGIRYCLSLDPPLPILNEELLRLLHEALALADAEDTHLQTGHGPRQPQTIVARQSNIEMTKLRVACIKLLTASMPLTDFFAKQQQTRQRVTSVYFKSLYSPTKEVKDVAHEGLRMVLMHQARLPKDLLQTGLRPILMNLADAKRLNPPGLEALARLLELLTHYFKVEIGTKLLDHYRAIADPQMLQQSSRLPLSENEGIQKLVRLANIFHLLPSAANQFLENLVNAIVQTEAQMHFSGQSPFSEPLAKYLDRYPVEAVNFFSKYLQFPRHVRTLRSILQAQLAPNLLRELLSRMPQLVSDCFDKSHDMPTLVMSGLLLVLDVAELVPEFLSKNYFVVDRLLDLWHREPNSFDGSGVASLSDSYHRSTQLLNIFKVALTQSRRIDLLFEIPAIFSRNLPVDPIHISQFLYTHVAANPSLTFRRNVLGRFLLWFEDPAYSWTHKTYALRFIVIPTLVAHAVSPSKAGLLDSDIIQWLEAHIWLPMSTKEETKFDSADDIFRIELLHFTTVMVQYYPDYALEAQKTIIKCAWKYITSEDAIVKHTAYLLAARFFEAWTVPPKFFQMVWTGLLSRPQVEGKALVRQALDILALVLQRVSPTESGYPDWAKTTRRLLAEESGGWSQVGLIYQLMARQSDLFYPVRALFVPHVVNNMHKLGLSQTSSVESRLLSIEVLNVIFEWEQKATNEMHVDGDSGEQPWITPLSFRESMVSYLVRLATTLTDKQSLALVVPKAMTLLRLVVGPGGWSDVTVKLGYFSRILQQPEFTADNVIVTATNTSKVLQIVASGKPDSWFTENATILAKLVRTGIMHDEVSMQDALHPIVERLLRLFPLLKEDDEQLTELSEWYSWIHMMIGESLRNGTNVRGALLLLKSAVASTPDRIQPYAGPLTKLLAIKTKDHYTPSQAPPHVQESTVRLILLMIEIAKTAIAFLGDSRRTLLTCLGNLVTKSKNMALCRYILDTGREWALNPRETVPSMKEKASLLQAMASFENRERGDGLMQNYLDLLFEIYTEPSLRRSDLTTKLEQQFLLGCRATDTTTREKFIDLLDASIPRSLYARLTYIFGVQNWEAIADRNWIYLALHLLLGSVESDSLIIPDRKTALDAGPLPSAFSIARSASIVRPIQRLMFLDPWRAHEAWVSLFPSAWACLSRREQVDLTHHIISLLSKEYHIAQAELRPNVILTLLVGIYRCTPPITLPPHLVKYLAKTFAAWHVSMHILESSLDYVRDDEVVVRDTVYDALAEVYAELAEDDLFYGLWRRRSLYPDTNTALAFEQSGMWEQAATMYEAAQGKSRSGVVPFSEPEYCLWEDHWILSAEKLQHWDTLQELARGEGNAELQLESAWRIRDWYEQKDSIEELIKELPDVATPRRLVFEAFMSLLKNPGAVDKNIEFTSKLENAMQLALRKWVSLPFHLAPSHIPLLQHFQQFVELQEAVQIFGSLSATNAGNLEKRSSDLKLVLQAWRERLPNTCDDISIWSDLVAWRQNVFNAINKTYIPLINATNQAGAATGTTNTYGYRGYHETAWIINRFAHVARKHGLLDVCVTSLNKIYTLPNIEISEAFLKLREQARCHYQKPGELSQGLEVINNTNLMYFSQPQKAEFYMLKGRFYERLERYPEAENAFNQAVQLDMHQAKAWAAWGKYCDRIFTSRNDMAAAGNAVNCYLQAAGLFKSRRARPLLTRVLWLLSLDDQTLAISKSFDQYKGEASWWYWITLIPQLCLSLSHREVKQARYILLNIAKLYPQALFFQLRTTREEMIQMKRQAAAYAQMRANSAQAQQSTPTPRPADADQQQAGQEAQGQGTDDPAQQATRPASAANGVQDGQDQKAPMRTGNDALDEVHQISKTAFPLLVMSLETIVDQLGQRFRSSPEEEIYRLVCMLLQDALTQYSARVVNIDDPLHLNPETTRHLIRLSQNFGNVSARAEYEEDFIKSKPTLPEYCQRLLRWRDRYENYLDSRPRIQTLDAASHYLIEYPYSKYDEVEIPGQYTEERDNNQAFVKLQKFGPKYENCRTQSYCFRRFTMVGHDNSKTSFAVQIPSARHCRREERVFQMLRMLNGVLGRKKETHKRHLHFHVPIAVPCHPSMRLLQNDASYITMGDIYEQFCNEAGINREDAHFLIPDKMRATLLQYKQANGGQQAQAHYRVTLRKELLDETRSKLVPEDVISRYFRRAINGPTELWRFRKEFTQQIAATCFLTFVLALSSRTPARFHISRASGQVALSEVLPGIPTGAPQPVIASPEAVPFRLTPNMQHFIGPVGTEGLLVASIMAMGRCLSEPEYQLEEQLSLFGRDEVLTWLHQQKRPTAHDATFRTFVYTFCKDFVRRVETLACKREREEAQNTQNLQGGNVQPIYKTVTNLVLNATNPVNIASMNDMFMPWF
ncbi:phosphatidylinositol kinase family protein [Phanerochaete sordida]|uniref:Phosphatidylinositol kinase family protein n=1 Tax=Phanerochaete sordida TaxID=48140 RepID=A0A9P3L8M9_9APHY|nr:phosphatidylinositol kinase family protein [Phanerochaete sordida]